MLTVIAVPTQRPGKTGEQCEERFDLPVINGFSTQWCCKKYYDKNNLDTPPIVQCLYKCFEPKVGAYIDCRDVQKTKGTLDPNITGGANAGILIDRDTSGNTNQSSNISSGITKQQAGGNSNGGNSATQGIGQSQYVGDPDTWCRTNPDGGKTCTCKAGTTDCLHMCGTVDCSSGCIDNTGKECKVELPGSSATSDTGVPGKSKTQGTFNPDLKTGSGGVLSSDPVPPTGAVPKYQCEGLKCTCKGDTDCNDMFEAGVCGDIASCSGSGDDAECSCLAT